MFGFLNFNCCKRRQKTPLYKASFKKDFPFKDYAKFCDAFKVSTELGINIPEETELPKMFHRWVELCDQAPELIKTKKIKEAVENLELISSDSLTDYNSLAAAFAILNKIITSYLWGETPPPQSIPKQLAIPFYDISMKLGIQPCNSYFEYVFNWKRIDKSKSILDMDNLTFKHTWTGTEDEIWSALPAICVGLHFGPIWEAIYKANVAVRSDDRVAFNKALEQALERLKIIEMYPKRLFGKCDTSAFYSFRRYNNGTDDKKDFPTGLYFEGVDKSFSHPGNAAIQDATYQAFEKAFGLKYEGYLKDIQQSVRVGMTKYHLKLIEFMEEHSLIREYAGLNTTSSTLYNEILESFSRFHFRHNSVLKHYIENNMKKENPERNMENAEGTGGSNLSKIKRRYEAILEHKL